VRCVHDTMGSHAKKNPTSTARGEGKAELKICRNQTFGGGTRDQNGHSNEGGKGEGDSYGREKKVKLTSKYDRSGRTEALLGRDK